MIFDRTAAALASVFKSVKSSCGCPYKPPARVATPVIFDRTAALPASVFDSEGSSCGCLLIPRLCGGHPQCQTKLGHAGADRKDFMRKRCTLAVRPAIRRVWKRDFSSLTIRPSLRLAVRPAIRRVWKQHCSVPAPLAAMGSCSETRNQKGMETNNIF